MERNKSRYIAKLDKISLLSTRRVYIYEMTARGIYDKAF